MKVFSTNNFWLDLDLIRAATEKKVKGTRKEKREKTEMSATMMTTFPSMAMVAGGALIASPSSVFREQVMDRLNGRCRPVQQALGGADALAKLENGNWQLLFLDRRVSDLDTGELTAIIQKRFPGIQVVLLDSAAELVGDNSEANALGGKKPHANTLPK